MGIVRLFMMAEFLIAEFLIAEFLIAEFLIAEFLIAEFLIKNIIKACKRAENSMEGFFKLKESNGIEKLMI